MAAFTNNDEQTGAKVTNDNQIEVKKTLSQDDIHQAIEEHKKNNYKRVGDMMIIKDLGVIVPIRHMRKL